ncbi:MAG: orotidine-5'-phosphate decarboxylase [Acidimicrobiales bacterium]
MTESSESAVNPSAAVTSAPEPADPVELAGVTDEVRATLVLALDVDDLVVATRMARELAPWFGVAKVGLELYSAAGPDAVAAMRELGYDVFLDLKLHDIPTTVGRAARVLGALGVDYLTLHAFGGVDMLRAGVEGLGEGATNAGLEIPMAVAVTVLTSDGGAPDHIVPQRVRLAAEAGCGGLVCAAKDLVDARTLAPRLVRIVPGIRLAGSEANDQANPATPGDAMAQGADLLVIGRTVTAAPDPAEAANQLVSELLG